MLFIIWIWSVETDIRTGIIQGAVLLEAELISLRTELAVLITIPLAMAELL